MDFTVQYLREEVEEAGIGYDDINADRSGFFILDNTAHNTSDAGNFLWGHAMKRLGFGLTTAKAGAHYNNATNDDTPGLLDSDSDQKAIEAGYKYKTN